MHVYYTTYENNLLYACFKHIMKRYLGLESKSLGGCLGHLALALIALVLVLKFAA